MSISKGNAGEHLVMADLLFQGFDSYWADRGNTAFDIACFWNKTKRATRLRVKTTSNSSAIWSTAKDGSLFKEMQSEDDFVVICDLKNGVRGSKIYIVPTPELNQILAGNHQAYRSFPGRNGISRKDSKMRSIRFFGADRSDNPSYGYDRKFSHYLEAWHLLK